MMRNDFEYSDAGMAMTKSFEGLRTEAYQDSGGVWTVGYGHVGVSVVAGMVIDEAEAVALLREDLAAAVACVNKGVTGVVTQGQFDAMVDFCFNVGRGNFSESTLLRMVNKGDLGGAAAQFGLWVHVGGCVAAGLVRRRKAEAAMFGGGVELSRVG
jgi:lysozyme